MSPAFKLKLIAIAGDIASFLTLLAAIPYELGPAAEMLPPKWKEWIVMVGVFATLGLRIIKRVTHPADTTKPA